MSRTQLTKLACTALLAATLSACGGGSSSTGTTSSSPPTGNNPPPPAPIEGVAMPSSVSVVTATNAS